jgi:hypothetical protein
MHVGRVLHRSLHVIVRVLERDGHAVPVAFVDGGRSRRDLDRALALAQRELGDLAVEVRHVQMLVQPHAASQIVAAEERRRRRAARRAGR